MTATPASLAHRFADALDRRDWPALRALLADDCRIGFVHDGRTFGPDDWVAFNDDYPGRWSVVAEDIVATDDRAVLRARVFNEEALFHLASFLTVADGLITEVVEVWADGHASPTEE
ncbi:MAG: nuclear transport factor 2 family protein [Nocardioides sp.]